VNGAAEFINGIDAAVGKWIVSVRAAWLNAPVRWITHLADYGAVWLALLFALLLLRRYRAVGLRYALCLFFCVLAVNLALKHIFFRVRPCDAIAEITALIKHPKDSSFPSGHAAMSFAAAFGVRRGLGKKAGIAAYVLASLIAVSRLYVGVHYLTDVLCGALIGTACAALAWKLSETGKGRR
jgi:undecaprenyl-diphosphatase